MTPQVFIRASANRLDGNTTPTVDGQAKLRNFPRRNAVTHVAAKDVGM